MVYKIIYLEKSEEIDKPDISEITKKSLNGVFDCGFRSLEELEKNLPRSCIIKDGKVYYTKEKITIPVGEILNAD